MNLWLPALVYSSAAVSLLGVAWRLFTWLRAPVPLKIVLTPGPVTAGGVIGRLCAEVLLFRSLFGADRGLWAAGWVFHLSLFFLAVGHFGGLVVPGLSCRLLGLAPEQYNHFALVTGGLFGVLAMIPLLALLLRRLAERRMRFLSTPGDYFALVLLLLIIVTGNQMRFRGGLDLEQARQFVSGLLSFHPAPPPQSPVFIVHLMLVCALLLYIPFSKLMHLGGIFLSPTLNQKNDPRERRHAGAWQS